MKTDQQLQHDVAEELACDAAVTASDIVVEVKDRIVTLSGHCGSYAEKLAAGKAAQKVAGVKAVVVELDICFPQGDVRTDGDVATAVRSILKWTVGLSEDAVKVQVEHGWLTLRGEVESAYQRHIAVRTISHLRGVTGISNFIEVRGEAAGEEIGDKIRSALMRHVEREANHITVSVRDGTVTLTGKVGSYAERKIARGVAWSAPGVRAVDDDLTIG